MNMGPQHPSCHGVLQLILTLDGETVTEVRELLAMLPRRLRDMHRLLDATPVHLARTRNIAHLDLTGCVALGVTGPSR